MHESVLYAFSFVLSLYAPVVLVVAFLAVTALRGLPSRRHRFIWLALFLFSLSANPIAQLFPTEALDNRRGDALEARALRCQLVGLPEARVREIFGEPDYIWPQGSGTVIWGYKQVPGIWLSSYFQVFLSDGVATGYEKNDT